MNIFQKSNERVEDVKRNSFDLSFQNNLTMKMGALYPVFCKEVISGDSFRIDSKFGLNFMPMYFPVQTRMRANLHYFYVRNRNLWTDYMDYFGRTKDGLVPPFIDTVNSFEQVCTTGSLGDYLGVPTTFAGQYGSLVKSNPRFVTGVQPYTLNVRYASQIAGQKWSDLVVPNGNYGWLRAVCFDVDCTLTTEPWSPTSPSQVSFPYGIESESWNDTEWHDNVVGFFGIDEYGTMFQISDVKESSDSYVFYRIRESALGKYCRTIVFVENVIRSNDEAYYTSFYDQGSNTFKCSIQTLEVAASPSNAVRDITPDTSPYYSSISPLKDKQIRLSAFPFRAYESIYNAFYRDPRNNPYILNGVAEYNKYLPTQAGGADTTIYPLHYRNWEQDFLTTAVQSPQQGVAPLVGITTNNQLGFRDADGSSYVAQFNVSDDGDSLASVDVTPSDSDIRVPRSIVDLASSGISIADFRNVNALQRWLEVNARRGYRFKDQIKSHYNVDVRFDELNMPEFIGGTSGDVTVMQVNQQSDSVDMPLGSYAGQAHCRAGSNNSVSHYCDEPGFIIGILSVSPTPNYSQLLPKYFTKSNILETFFPEFGHIGMQPILYNEVCPIQAFNANPDSLKETFGYQRAWYDYLSSVDEVHGLFRTNLRNFLINRVFDTKPELSPDFLLIDPEQTNDVFSVTLNEDKILGQVYFDVSCKRPIPLFGTPRLEA